MSVARFLSGRKVLSAVGLESCTRFSREEKSNNRSHGGTEGHGGTEKPPTSILAESAETQRNNQERKANERRNVFERAKGAQRGQAGIYQTWMYGVLSPKGAKIYQPGASPQVRYCRRYSSPEGATLSVPTDNLVAPSGLKMYKYHHTWGDAPGWYIPAPLARRNQLEQQPFLRASAILAREMAIHRASVRTVVVFNFL